jgi:anti-sigma regulatory factor (Ser/Thr protein kinase)
MEWHFWAADKSAANAARRSFADFVRGLCNEKSACQTAEIVYGELVGNAIRHAPGPIDIRVQADAHGLVRLDVCDTGPAFTLTGTLPTPDSECGRGLYIVAKLCPDLSLTRTAVGNRVSAMLQLDVEPSRLHLVEAPDTVQNRGSANVQSPLSDSEDDDEEASSGGS